MRGLAAMRRRITLGDWEGPGFGGKNTPMSCDGWSMVIYLDGAVIGLAHVGAAPIPYSFALGEYPHERYGGAFRTENAMLDAVARHILKGAH